MNLFQPLFNLLNKPFPEQESSFGAPKTLAIISVFITFFLYIFQPFGIHNLQANQFWICVGFGAMTFLGTIIYEFIIGSILKLKGEAEKWTFGKWVLNNLGIMMTISLVNFLYARLVLFGFIQWELFPHMVYGTFMIGLIPVIGLGWFAVTVQEKKYKNIAAHINQMEKTSTNEPEIEKKEMKEEEQEQLFDIPIPQIKYVQGLQNYVSIGYTDANGQFKKKVERATLKHILAETAGSSIVKSHRSFLVNRKAIISTSGNAQGLLLHLSDSDRTIPVSRSFVSAFKLIQR